MEPDPPDERLPADVASVDEFAATRSPGSFHLGDGVLQRVTKIKMSDEGRLQLNVLEHAAASGEISFSVWCVNPCV